MSSIPAHTFRFKTFDIVQQYAAMKVNTDGVLLGAWADVGKARSILDIGTGTGVIALMATQRNPVAQIVGVEIDDLSYKEALHNANQSQYVDRVSIIHASFQEYVNTCTKRFDHIITNPPFFTSGTHSPKGSKSVARHTKSLSFESLLTGVDQLLSSSGYFSLILPVTEGEQFMLLAEEIGLHLHRQTHVYINEKTLGRYLLTYSRQAEKQLTPDKLLIRQADGTYSQVYKALTSDFYLNM